MNDVDRPRTYPYFTTLPYDVETVQDRLQNLEKIVDELCKSFYAEDWSRSIYWNTELRDWLSLKFHLPKQHRIRLIKIYYEVICAFGVDPRAHARFMSTFLTLTKRRFYVDSSELTLDWRPLWQVIKRVVIPSGELIVRAVASEDLNHLKTLAHAQQYFATSETPAMLEEFLPLFQTSILGDAFLSVYLVCGFLPTSSYEYANEILPSIFHLWNLLASSHIADAIFIEFLSRWARDAHTSTEPFKELLSNAQLDYVFTHFLRLMKIPVGNSAAPCSKNLDAHARNLFFNKKFSAAKDMARLIIYLLPDDSILERLEIFFEATETFFHPSNSGNWLSPLASILYELTTFFQMRYNREISGETPVKQGRNLDQIRDRFVLILRKVTFMATYARSGEVQNLAQASLQALAHLAPTRIVPAALKRIYPSLQGLVEAHRTTASLHYLASLTPIIAADHRWRAHITSLITLALPGIDANDLNKTSITFIFLTQVSHILTIEDLSENGNTVLAVSWVQQEMARLENIIGEDDDDTDSISDSDMLAVVKSSTAAWSDIVIMFLDRIFLLLENIPPTAAGRATGETQVSNDLSCLLPAFFHALSPEIFEMAIEKVLKFVTSRTLYGAADNMSSIINALCKVNPKLTWGLFYDVLDASIRTEILENGAGSTRSAGLEVLPKDRGLVWYIRSLEGMVDAGGPLLYEYRKPLRALINFLMQNCVSQATEYTGILVSSYQEGLIETYTIDGRRVNSEEDGQPANGLDSWCLRTEPQKLKIRWHVASPDEIIEATDFFMQTSESLLRKIQDSITSSQESGGKVKQGWTDVLVSQLSYLENLLSGATELFTSQRRFRSDEEVDLKGLDYCCKYPSGYALEKHTALEKSMHDQRHRIGQHLHLAHQYLTEYHADDILVFDVLLFVMKTWFGNVGYQRADGSQSKLNNIYVEDIAYFKTPGKRKHYPRQYLVRRALLYHVQRRKHSTLTVDPSPLHWTMLDDLKRTAIGSYTEIRIIAQSALNLALRAVADTRASVVPFFLEAIRTKDEDKIKGALYILSGKGLKSYLGRDYAFFPAFLKQLVLLNNVEKPSMQLPVKQAFLECALKSRPPAGVCVYEKKELEDIRSQRVIQNEIEHLVQARMKLDRYREEEQLKLRDDLVQMTDISDWRIACAAASALGAGISSSILPPSVKLTTSVLKLAVSDHPHLRAIATSQMAQLLATCWLRVLTKGDTKDAILENLTIPGRHILTSRKDGNFGSDILSSLSDPHPAYFVDNERAGWLAWPQQLEVFEPNNGGLLMQLDPLTTTLFAAMGPILTLDWVLRNLEFWKEEPKEGSGKFRSSLQHVMRLFFICARRMPGSVTLEELKPHLEALCAKGALHYHSRVGAEVLSGLIGSLRYESDEVHDTVWNWCGPILESVLKDRLTPDNVSYWQHCVASIFMHRDPRRFFPLLQIVSNLPLDMESHSAFAESAKISVLRKTVAAVGWHYQSGDTAISKFLAHIDHPYKRVRDELGRALNNLFAMQYYESHATVDDFIKTNYNAQSSLGVIPYQPNEILTTAMSDTFTKIRRWRAERPPGQEAPSRYTMAAKTISTWILNSLDMTEAYLLLPFVPDMILPETLHMLDVKEDTDLLSIAITVFKQLGNIVYPVSLIKAMVDSLVCIMTRDPLWHHRGRIMAVVQVFFYRNMFILSHDDRQRLFDSVVFLLSDNQLEVRESAAATIAGMIRASSYDRDNTIKSLISRFTEAIDDASLAKTRVKSRRKSQVLKGDTNMISSTIIKRHSAVLGLSALVLAFPYETPPTWLPPVLARLARCSDDPHPIASSVKRVLASFKKTHNDTWQFDQKVFTQEELDDLSEPSHTYFA